MTTSSEAALVPSMLALRWHGRGDLRLDRVAVPEARPGQVLVAVERVGICGTDLEEYLHGPIGIPVGGARRPPAHSAPLTLGHEIVGRIVDAPDGRWRPGTLVVPDVVHGCGKCWWCSRHEEHLCPDLAVLGLQTDGGLATYVLADAATCVAVPDHVSVDVAAFAEPTAVALRAVAKAPALAGSVVAVIGAGTIGCLVAQAATAAGAVIVVAVDPNPTKRALAGGFGATACSPGDAADAVASASGGRGADVVFECAGPVAAVRAAADLVRPGGYIILVGTGDHDIALPLRRLIHQEVTVRGSAAHLWDTDVTAAVAALASGAIEVGSLLSSVVPIERAITDGFERLRHDPDITKILIDCTTHPAEAPTDDRYD